MTSPRNLATGQDDINALKPKRKRAMEQKTSIRNAYMLSLILLFRIIIDLKM